MNALSRLVLIFALLVAGLASAQINTEHFFFHTSGNNPAMANELAADVEQVHKEVASQLGALDVSVDPITVRVFQGEQAFKAAMPHIGSIDWAAGIAFPSQSLILLKVDRNTRFDIHDIFRHEISHVVLHRASGGKPLPLWFVEGVAVHQAGERLVERWQKTATATLTDGLLPLSTIAEGFPTNSHRADMAYAQSTAFVAWLLEQHGWGGIRALVRRVRDGEGFGRAIERVYGAPLHELEARFKEELERSATWIPILTGTTVLWALITLLFVWSWLVKRRRAKRRLAQLDDAIVGLDDEFA